MALPRYHHDIFNPLPPRTTQLQLSSISPLPPSSSKPIQHQQPVASVGVDTFYFEVPSDALRIRLLVYMIILA